MLVEIEREREKHLKETSLKLRYSLMGIITSTMYCSLSWIDGCAVSGLSSPELCTCVEVGALARLAALGEIAELASDKMGYDDFRCIATATFSACPWADTLM